jgi:hypothetical protein
MTKVSPMKASIFSTGHFPLTPILKQESDIEKEGGKRERKREREKKRRKKRERLEGESRERELE